MKSHTVVGKTEYKRKACVLEIYGWKIFSCGGDYKPAPVKASLLSYLFVFLDCIVSFSLFSFMSSSFFFLSLNLFLYVFLFLYLILSLLHCFQTLFMFFFNIFSPRPFIMWLYIVMDNFIFFSCFSCNVVLGLHCQEILHSGSSVSLLYML
jgi:hypothetical protein